MMNGYNFSERTRTILSLARQEASRLRHQYVGTEHVLLGLIAEGEGVGATVLRNLGVDLLKLKARIEVVLKRGNAARETLDVPYTSRAKKVLEFALAEARELDHQYVGSEHLLLGLLREEKGIAASVLVEAGATVDAVRAETLRLLGPEADAEHGDESVRTIASVSVDIKLSDGSHVRGDFRSVAAAVHFLKNPGYKSPRGGAP